MSFGKSEWPPAKDMIVVYTERHLGMMLEPADLTARVTGGAEPVCCVDFGWQFDGECMLWKVIRKQTDEESKR